MNEKAGISYRQDYGKDEDDATKALTKHKVCSPTMEVFVCRSVCVSSCMYSICIKIVCMCLGLCTYVHTSTYTYVYVFMYYYTDVTEPLYAI